MIRHLAWTLALCCSAVTLAHAAVPASRLQSLPGLEITEYPRHEDQDNKENVYLEPASFGKPIGEPVVTESLAPWTWNEERNAIARGQLTIEKSGDYAFTTDSFYDRNLLMINGEVVCGFRDGTSAIKTIHLEKGPVKIEVVGYVDSRGSAEVRWRPPGQRELSPIPEKLLRHQGVPKIEPPTGITVVAKDFVIEVYHNGVRVPDEKRKLLLDRFGATAERIDGTLKPGDWIVFHVANNRLRHKGTKYFAMAAPDGDQPFGFVSDPNSPQWSSCDDPARSRAFIEDAQVGAESRAVPIARPWEEGLKFMKQYAGDEFPGKPVWGTAPSTWLKFVVPGEPAEPAQESRPVRPPAEAIPPGSVIAGFEAEVDAILESLPKIEPPMVEKVEEPEIDSQLAIENPRRWPIQVLSAIYGTGGKNADVTEAVTRFVQERRFFAASPGYLGADPNPYWNKGLHIVYMKDGVRREQHRNENEHVLPESFYGPQDAAELERWLPGTRWSGPRGEIQFHPGGLATGPQLKANAQWEALSSNKLRLTWAKDDSSEFGCDYVWSTFKEARDGRNTYRLLK